MGPCPLNSGTLLRAFDNRIGSCTLVDGTRTHVLAEGTGSHAPAEGLASHALVDGMDSCAFVNGTILCVLHMCTGSRDLVDVTVSHDLV